LSPELLENEDFLHAYFSTIKAAANSRRREKIKLFSRLFKNSFKTEMVDSIDDYEELLKIVDELSYREILELCSLHKLEVKYRNVEAKADWYRTEMFWDNYISSLVTELGIRKDEVFDNLQRLQRTGCYEVYDSFLGNDKKFGHLTPSFYRLVELLEVGASGENDDII
jgi:hypothetical protein